MDSTRPCIVLGGFLLACLFVFFSNFTFGFSQLSSKKVKNNSIQFLNSRTEENLVMNNKDNRVFMSRNYQSDSCPLEI